MPEMLSVLPAATSTTYYQVVDLVGMEDTLWIVE